MGSITKAVASRKAVIIQLNSNALSENSLPITGNATLMDDTRKVPKKEVVAMIRRVALCDLFQDILIRIKLLRAKVQKFSYTQSCK
jgi:hypothetical protein